MLWLTYISMGLLGLIGVFLIFIILLQRGRGGGLAGALGGMGGQSAFGTKAGDMFTRITVVLAVIWIVLCAGQIPLLRAVSTNRFKGGSGAPEELVAPPIKDAQGNPFPPDEPNDETDMGATEPEGETAPATKSDDESTKSKDKPAKEESKEKPAEESKSDSEEKTSDGESEK
jgi:preprotein translocase subunit SecG